MYNDKIMDKKGKLSGDISTEGKVRIPPGPRAHDGEKAPEKFENLF